VKNQQGAYEVSVYLGMYERKYKIDPLGYPGFDFSEVSIQDSGSRIFRKRAGFPDPDDASPRDVFEEWVPIRGSARAE